MARLLTTKDCYALVNAMVKDITGQQSTVTATDLSSFISVGETIMSNPTETVLNSLGMIIGKTLVASRPYSGKFDLIKAIDSGVFSNRLRKISYYAKDAQASGAFNTDLYTNLAGGFTAGENKDEDGAAQSTKSQYEQNPAVVLEMNFGGSSTWQDSLTIYEVQLQEAFTSPDSFNEFVSGMLTERRNDIESQMEAYRRAIVLNEIAGIYDMDASMPGSVINLTKGFNDTFGTEYTSEQLRTTYLKEFLEYLVSVIKITSDKFTNRSKNYHWSPAKSVGGVSYTLLRHTPKDRQKLMLYNPLMVKARAIVMPEIFNPSYLSIDNYEPVDYWQNENEPSKISVTPAVPSTSGATAGTQVAGTAVALDCVVGILYDSDAMMADFQLDRATTSPLEARKLYHNLWWTFRKNGINDFTEKACIFIMQDPVTAKT